MWTVGNRVRYNRVHLRYPSDLTGAGWAQVAPLIARTRRREVDERALMNGIIYVLSTECQWRYIPKDLPPKSTVYR
jgi:transposase